jgi:hypothetical protein
MFKTKHRSVRLTVNRDFCHEQHRRLVFLMETECVYHEVLCVSSEHYWNRFRGVVVRPVDIDSTWCSIAEYFKMCLPAARRFDWHFTHCSYSVWPACIALASKLPVESLKLRYCGWPCRQEPMFRTIQLLPSSDGWIFVHICYTAQRT